MSFLARRKGTAVVRPVTSEEKLAEDIRGLEKAFTREVDSEEIRDRQDVPITAVKISLLSDQEIIDRSVLEVTSSDLLSENETGPNSSALGATNKRQCGTCRGGIRTTRNREECHGHYGYIDLKGKYFHPLFRDKIILVLKVICNHCGKLIMSPDQLQKYTRIGPKDRLRFLVKDTKNAGPCLRESCKKVSPQAIKSSDSKCGDKIITTGEQLTPEIVYQRFDAISDQEARIMGFGPGVHPRNMIIGVLPVIPNAMRPGIYLNGVIYHDKITEKYQAIVDVTRKITGEESEKTLTGYRDTINRLLCELFKGQGKNSAVEQDDKSFAARFKGKGGLPKSALGVRLNRSSRSVIGPGHDLEFGEIGLPVNMSKYLYVEVIVTPANKPYLDKLLEEGRIASITAGSAYNPDNEDEDRLVGVRRRVIPGKNKTLVIGDTVERFLQNGDYILSNRQPSIKKETILAYRIKLVKDRVTELPLFTTPGHNADFDGDEMSNYSVKSPEAMAELVTLMSAEVNIVSEKTSRPEVGLVMDAVSGFYLLTREEEAVDSSTFLKAVDQIKKTADGTVSRVNVLDLWRRAEALGKHRYAGTTLFSALYPPDFFYDQNDVLIVNGILVAGRITKNNVGPAHRAITQDLLHKYGFKTVSAYLTNASRLITFWLNHVEFTVGVSDLENDRGILQRTKRRMISDIEKSLTSLGGIPKGARERKIYNERVNAIVDKVSYMGDQIINGVLKEVFTRTRILARLNERLDNLDQLNRSDLLETTQLSLRAQILVFDTEDRNRGSDLPDSILALEQDLEKKTYRRSEVKQLLKETIRKLNRSLQDIPEDEVFVNRYELAPKVGARAGSKGSATSIGSMYINVGAQYLRRELLSRSLFGERIDISGTFRLPGEPLKIDQIGYCVNSYYEGLTPAELQYTQQASIEGTFNTSNSTPDVGDTRTKIYNFVANLAVHRDGTVRQSGSTIVNFSYGGDNMKPDRLMKVKSITGVTVTSFVDLQALADDLNAQKGWIRKDVRRRIEQGKVNHPRVEADLKEMEEIILGKRRKYFS